MTEQGVGFKNVTLHKFLQNGVESYRLLGDAGEIVSFSVFIGHLRHRETKFNTFRSYARALAHFFDYFYEASYHILAMEGRSEITRGDLKEVINGWKDYLTLGQASGVPLVGAVSRSLPRSLVSAKTSNLYHAALKFFLGISEQIRKEGAELRRHGLHHSTYVTEVLFEDIGKHLAVSGHQRAAMVRATMLSGVIAGGPKKLKVDFLPSIDIGEDEFDEENLFPLDRFEDFTKALTTARDKALYCFYAASGCRTSEALQLLWEDMDLVKQEVRLVNPTKRINHPSYLYLTPDQRNKLAWKARTTEESFLIEPRASMFWRFLKEYVDKEYIPHGKHKFVFQYLKGQQRGRPYFTSKASSRREIFKRAQQVADLPDTLRGPHSLRHAYGTYLLNYMPNPGGGYGLPIAIVRVVMGHSSLKSTQKYAKLDKDMVRAQIAFANQAVFATGLVAQSQNDLKIAALINEAKKLGWNDGTKQLEAA